MSHYLRRGVSALRRTYLAITLGFNVGRLPRSRTSNNGFGDHRFAI